jgi:hypothetical protein
VNHSISLAVSSSGLPDILQLIISVVGSGPVGVTRGTYSSVRSSRRTDNEQGAIVDMLAQCPPANKFAGGVSRLSGLRLGCIPDNGEVMARLNLRRASCPMSGDCISMGIITGSTCALCRVSAFVPACGCDSGSGGGCDSGWKAEARRLSAAFAMPLQEEDADSNWAAREVVGSKQFSFRAESNLFGSSRSKTRK